MRLGVDMKLTKLQWQTLERQLTYPYASVKLKCDSHEIIARVEKAKGLKYSIMVYVDGEFKGIWLNGEDERCLKFYRARKHYLWRGKLREELRDTLRKRRPKESRDYCKEMLEKYFFTWVPYWPSASAFFRHIRKTCKQIEIMD